MLQFGLDFAQKSGVAGRRSRKGRIGLEHRRVVGGVWAFGIAGGGIEKGRVHRGGRVRAAGAEGRRRGVTHALGRFLMANAARSVNGQAAFMQQKTDALQQGQMLGGIHAPAGFRAQGSDLGKFRFPEAQDIRL